MNTKDGTITGNFEKFNINDKGIGDIKYYNGETYKGEFEKGKRNG